MASDRAYEHALKFVDVYLPSLFLECKALEQVPFLGALERLAHLDSLFDKNDEIWSI
jgi:hypothetical protein